VRARFGYVFDPLFLVCCALYAANRWLIKPHTHIAFFHSWFSDLWLIPCALPPVLLIQRWCGLRTHDRPPTDGEILAHLAGWSVLFEAIGPHIMRTTGDPWDVAAYAFGSGVGYVWWRLGKSPSGFDWLAPHYRWMERILAGEKLQRCRTAYLKDVLPVRKALLLGEGRGRFLDALLEQQPDVRCVCVDASERMLDLTRSRLGSAANNVAFVRADLASWTPPESGFDLIVADFVFDCFTDEQLAPMIARWAGAAAPNARWLVAEFHLPERGLARWRAKAILSVMYMFFRWATGIPADKLPNPDALLRQHGFELRDRRITEWGLLQTDWWERQPPVP